MFLLPTPLPQNPPLFMSYCNIYEDVHKRKQFYTRSITVNLLRIMLNIERDVDDTIRCIDNYLHKLQVNTFEIIVSQTAILYSSALSSAGRRLRYLGKAVPFSTSLFNVSMSFSDVLISTSNHVAKVSEVCVQIEKRLSQRFLFLSLAFFYDCDLSM